jgi:DNA helicase-2/ATP-dependent DNA helicase PcrA
MSVAPAAEAILEGLNPAQRRAVDYGLGTKNGIAPPLLIAAGAGIGKTKTLAHRVARLILGGVDPRRLLLLTFTRRAAREMTRCAQQILAANRGGATIAAEAELLSWSGTFHSIGNRLLRQYAASLALNPAFTVLDRTDSADLMDVVRNDLGLARARSRFPQKDTCLAIYSYTVNAGRPLAKTVADFYQWCDEWEAELKRLFAAMSLPNNTTTCSIMTIYCCTRAIGLRRPARGGHQRGRACAAVAPPPATHDPRNAARRAAAAHKPVWLTTRC